MPDSSPPDRDVEVNWLLIVRACHADPEGPAIETRVGYTDYPSDGKVVEIGAAADKVFVQAFGCGPARVGSAVLPFVAEYDEVESDA